MLEFIWLARNAPLAQPMMGLIWTLVFYALFTFFPFIIKKHLRGMPAWISSAVAGLLQWPLVWAAADRILGHSCMALVPAFFALPSLGSLAAVVFAKKDEWRLSKLAWFGGLALLFITLIIPIQFDKEWLTVGWTLEGAALLWLYRRVPHDGLRAWGLALLAICFARLALNPAVLSYHPRTGIPLINWYLWVYGIAAISYYVAAWQMRSQRRFMETDMPPLLNAAGTILAFLLVNIEIADYFSTGSVITFNFSGNLAQDMAYSLSWGVFAILMLMVGFRQTSKGSRYASLGLLTVTILKVFLHDLWRLGQLFRVASFIGLAVVLILVSFLYQKFLGERRKIRRRVMKNLNHLAWLVLLMLPMASFGVSIPAAWHYSQDIQTTAPGLQKVRLPVETLSAAQPSLSDLRLFDAAGKEISFLIDSPAPEPSRRLSLERMTMTMENKKTVITGTVPAAMAAHGFEAVMLFTSTDDFLKSVTLEASRDGRMWTTLLRQAPIFKQAGDVASSTLHFAKGSWSYLRISLDDSETPPLRIAGVGLETPGRPINDLVELEPEILEVASDAHKTEVSLRLPFEGLPVDSLRLDVPETTFRRSVRLSSRVFSAGEFRENVIAQGSVYRVTLGSQRMEELSMLIGQFVSGPFVTLTIDNGDSPPLTLKHLWVRTVPRDLIFDAPAGGVFQLYSGNPKAPPRSYDLADLRGSLAKAIFKNASAGLSLQTPPINRRQRKSPVTKKAVTSIPIPGTSAKKSSWNRPQQGKSSGASNSILKPLRITKAI